MTNPIHEANRRKWDAASEVWARGADKRGVWWRCPSEPHLALAKKAIESLGDLTGKRVCVLGSGDNQAAFALAGLGAAVTSVDISQPQLDVAELRAEELGLAIEFVRADVTDLSALSDEAFGVVYTGGHVAVWVSDLQTYYDEAVRILERGGLLLIDEYHPFRRVWKESPDALTVAVPYFERGPFEYEESPEVLNREAGSFKSYEFHWTVSDYVNTVLSTGCSLLALDEHGTDVAGWESAPMQGLPEYLLIVARKPGNAG